MAAQVVVDEVEVEMLRGAKDKAEAMHILVRDIYAQDVIGVAVRKGDVVVLENMVKAIQGAYDDLTNCIIDIIPEALHEEGRSRNAGGRLASHAGMVKPIGGVLLLAWSVTRYALVDAECGLASTKSRKTGGIVPSATITDMHLDLAAGGMGWDALVESVLVPKEAVKHGLSSVAAIKNNVHYMRLGLSLVPPDAPVAQWIDVLIAAIGRLVMRGHGTNAFDPGDSGSHIPHDSEGRTPFDVGLYCEEKHGGAQKRLSHLFLADMFVFLCSILRIAQILDDSIVTVPYDRLVLESHNVLGVSKGYQVVGEEREEVHPVTGEVEHVPRRVIEVPESVSASSSRWLVEGMRLLNAGQIPNMARVMDWVVSYVDNCEPDSIRKGVFDTVKRLTMTVGDATVFAAYNPMDVASPQGIVTWRSGVEFYNAVMEDAGRAPEDILRDDSLDTSLLAIVTLMQVVSNCYMNFSNTSVSIVDMCMVLMDEIHEWEEEIGNTDAPIILQQFGGWRVAHLRYATEPGPFPQAFQMWLAATLAANKHNDSSGFVDVQLIVDQILAFERNKQHARRDGEWVSASLRTATI